jgi:non-heme chloroperoxidase
MAATTRSVTTHESEQVARANESGLQPVVFIHGLWLLPSSWDRWATVLSNPANRNRAVPLTYKQFRFGFADAVSEDEAKVNSKNPDRGPLLIISGEKDNTVPWAITNASSKKQKRNEGATEIVEMKGRGHALTIDSGWREVADTALAFVRRFV